MKGTLAPRIIVIVVSLIAIVAFFLPFISATPDYAKYMDSISSEKIYSSTDLTVGDMKDMSLFKYAKVYAQAGQEIYRDQSTGIFYAVLIGAIGVAAIITLLCALGKKPVLLMIFSIVMGGAFYLVNWDFLDRRIMPDSNRVWGIAHSMYYPCAVILLICAIWILIAKRKAKEERIP